MFIYSKFGNKLFQLSLCGCECECEFKMNTFQNWLKNIYAMVLLDWSKFAATSSKMHSIASISKYSNNKDYYTTYKQCLVNLMLTLYRDSDSGWLLLAAFFYFSYENIKMTSILHLSEEIVYRDLYCLPYWWNEPTIKQIRG